jgi:hypothetical protein
MSIDIERILLELKSLPEYDDQISLQTVNGNNDPSYGTGWLQELHHDEADFTVPLFDIPYTNSVIAALGMTRTRVMRLEQKTCYSYHQDPTQRIHIPLITNDNCFMVISDQIIRYPANGSHYHMDTTQMHTAVNASYEDRIHIVGCISDT